MQVIGKEIDYYEKFCSKCINKDTDEHFEPCKECIQHFYDDWRNPKRTFINFKKETKK